MITPDLAHVAYTMLAGGVAGCLGALLGIGGGVFLVPFLNLVIGLPFASATGISLITVIATSSVTSASKGRLHLVNLRLGMVLEIFTTSGSLLGIWLINRSSEAKLRSLFAWIMAGIAVIVLSRLHRRNVIADTSIDVGVLGGRFHDDDSGGEVVYRVRRTPLAVAVSLLAGVVSMFGIGGGVLKVPVLNAWCGVPMRAAAATSALMIGATAVVGAINAFVRGNVLPEVAASAVLGVLAGSYAGFHIAGRSKARSHRILMAMVLIAVAIVYFVVPGPRR